MTGLVAISMPITGGGGEVGLGAASREAFQKIASSHTSTQVGRNREGWRCRSLKTSFSQSSWENKRLVRNFAKPTHPTPQNKTLFVCQKNSTKYMKHKAELTTHKKSIIAFDSKKDDHICFASGFTS